MQQRGGRSRLILTVLATVFVITLVALLLLRQDDVNLSGAAVSQRISEEETAEPIEAPVEPTQAPSEPTQIPPEPTEVPPEPTEVPPEPTQALPEPTKMASTEEATPELLPPILEVTAEATAEVTEQATAPLPELTVTTACTPSGVAFTVTNSGGDMLNPEIYTIDDNPAGELQLASGQSEIVEAGYGQPTFSLTGASTQPDEPCNQPPLLEISSLACMPMTGVAITVTNSGGAMLGPETYTIDENSAGELQLASGESEIVEAGYGRPAFSIAGINAQPDEPCIQPPDLGLISAACAPATGVVFAVTNSGGPMLYPQSYTLDGEPAGEFQLGENETIEIEAGYGMPAFASGDMSAVLENVCNPPGGITGLIWMDVNGDSIHDADEAGIEAATVTLSGSDSSVQQAVTTADGLYSFANLLAGDYTLQISDLAGDLLPTYDLDSGDPSAALVPVGLEQEVVNFGYQPVPRGSISGVIWADVNGDGLRTADEPGLNGITLALSSMEGDVQVITDTDGVYQFADLDAGDYTITIPMDELASSFAVTFDPDTEPDAATLLAVADDEVTDINFGLQPTRLGSISGVIWLETANFGTRDAEETGIAGIALQLLDSAGNVVQTQTLSADGIYQFSGLLPGVYTVNIDTATLPDRLFVTFNVDGSQNFATTITLSPGVDAANIEFGLVGAF